MPEKLSILEGRTLSNTAENIRVMPSRPSCDRLRQAVANAAARDAESMESLRLTVRELTVELREQGATPEAVLISLKTVVGAGGGPPISSSPMDWNGYILREKMSSWCIEEYFSEETPKSRNASTT